MKKRSTAIIVSILLTLAVFICFLFIGRWESTDDYLIYRSIINSEDGFGVFTNILLSKLVRVLYLAMPDSVNWWYAVEFVFMLFASIAIVYSLSRSMPKKLWLITLPALFLVLFLAGVARVNFTRVAAIVATGGAALMLEGVRTGESRRYAIVCTILGCLLFLIGSMYRFAMAIVILPFMAMALAYRLFVGKEGFSAIPKRIKSFSNWKRIAVVLLPLVFSFMLVQINNACLTDEEREFAAYNTVRAEIQDYVDLYPEYSEEIGEKTGLDEQQYKATFLYMDNDRDVFDTESVGRVAALREERSAGDILRFFAKSVREMLSTVMIKGAALLLVITLLWDVRSSIVPLALNGCAFIAYIMYLSFGERVVPRVWNPLFLLIAVCVAYMAFDRDMEIPKVKWQTRLRKYGYIAIALACVAYGGRLAYKLRDNLSKGFEFLTGRTQKEEAVTDIIDQRDDLIVITTLLDSDIWWGTPWASSFPVLTHPMPAGYCDNYLLVGDWESRLPYYNDRMESLGISNPMAALIEDPRVYSEYSGMLYDYLSDKYEGEQTVSGMQYIKDVLLVKYCSSIDDNRIEASDAIKAKLTVNEYIELGDDAIPARHIGCELDESASEDFSALYLNMDIDGVRKTFRIENLGNGVLGSYLFNVDKGVDLESANMVLFGLAEDGSYHAIADID